MSWRHWQNWALRIGFFIVYAWFGITKVFEVSPASQLVADLLNMTMYFVPSRFFLIFFGGFEVVLGTLFLFPKLTKLAVIATFLHLLTTMLPLVLLPQHTWLSFGVLSTEGQYIMKNLILFGALWGIWLDYQGEITATMEKM